MSTKKQTLFSITKSYVFTALIACGFSVGNSVSADFNKGTGFYDLHYYGYTEPGLMDVTSLLPFVTIGFQDLEAIKDAKGMGTFSGTFEASLGYVRYDGTGEHDHWNYKGLAELYTPIAGNFYAGLGYRRLFDDFGPGRSSTGAATYDRLSEYYYLPVGYLFNLEGGGRIKAQYNVFIEGYQTSYFTQVGYGYDPKNTQTSGYGLDLSYEAPSGNWQGYARYWYIDRSNTVYWTSGLLSFSAYEPQNETIEIGFRVPF